MNNYSNNMERQMLTNIINELIAAAHNMENNLSNQGNTNDRFSLEQLALEYARVSEQKEILKEQLLFEFLQSEDVCERAKVLSIIGNAVGLPIEK